MFKILILIEKKKWFNECFRLSNMQTSKWLNWLNDRCKIEINLKKMIHEFNELKKIFPNDKRSSELIETSFFFLLQFAPDNSH